METDLIKWIILGISFFTTLFFSFFHVALSASSKIALSRFLEDKERSSRLKILEIYDELKISVEYMRFLFFTLFLVCLFFIFPRQDLWPIWLFLAAMVVYFIFFDITPRFINAFRKKWILSIFLPTYKIPYILSRPLLFIPKTKALDKEQEEQHEASEEEIQVLIDEAKEEGIIEKEEGLLLKSVVEFGDTIVREIMTPRVSMICIPKDATIEKLRNLVIKEKHSRIPVFKERVDNIEGIVIAKDLLEYSEDRHKNNPLEPLIRPVHFIPESMKVQELLGEFQERKQKLAIVVDEHGGVSGLVTMEDLVEEIVGEIQDEYDKDKVELIEQGPLDYIVLGDVEVEDLEKLFNVDLAKDDYITVGGLIIHHLGRLPERGEHIEIKGLMLEILDVDQKRIKKLRIRKKQA